MSQHILLHIHYFWEENIDSDQKYQCTGLETQNVGERVEYIWYLPIPFTKISKDKQANRIDEHFWSIRPYVPQCHAPFHSFEFISILMWIVNALHVISHWCRWIIIILSPFFRHENKMLSLKLSSDNLTIFYFFW